jgi:predicted restriction endonuclease
MRAARPGWTGRCSAIQRCGPVRIGQNAFKALVQEAYGRRCAVTGDKIVPVVQAAHIRPVGGEGLNRVDNGLLLRSDVHTLFDAGYAGVHPQKRTLLVMAVVQLRNPTAADRKVAAGKSPDEAMRCLKRRLSDIVYRTILDDLVASQWLEP